MGGHERAHPFPGLIPNLRAVRERGQPVIQIGEDLGRFPVEGQGRARGGEGPGDPNAEVEDRVAGDQHTGIRVQQRHMPRGVAGSVMHLQTAGDIEHMAVFQSFADHNWLETPGSIAQKDPVGQ